MILTHLVSLRLLGGASQTTTVSTDVPRGRRHRTRRYKTPTPAALEQEYQAIVKAAPERVIRPLVGRYLLKGDLPLDSLPPPAAVDWEALAHDAETVVKLFDLYLEYVEDEETVTVLLLGEF